MSTTPEARNLNTTELSDQRNPAVGLKEAQSAKTVVGGARKGCSKGSRGMLADGRHGTIPELIHRPPPLSGSRARGYACARARAVRARHVSGVAGGAGCLDRREGVFWLVAITREQVFRDGESRGDGKGVRGVLRTWCSVQSWARQSLRA
jgi:hypothetical protein